MDTSKLRAGIILGLTLLIGAGNSSAYLWDLQSHRNKFYAIHTISVTHFNDIGSMKDSKSMSITCVNNVMNNWLLDASFGNLGAIESRVKAEIQFDNETPEKLSDLIFTQEISMNDSPKGNDLLNFKILEVEFDDLDSFISMNQRLARSHNFTIRVYNEHGGHDMDVRLSTSDLNEILPEFHRRCKEPQQ